MPALCKLPTLVRATLQKKKRGKKNTLRRCVVDVATHRSWGSRWTSSRYHGVEAPADAGLSPDARQRPALREITETLREPDRERRPPGHDRQPDLEGWRDRT